MYWRVNVSIFMYTHIQNRERFRAKGALQLLSVLKTTGAFFLLQEETLANYNEFIVQVIFYAHDSPSTHFGSARISFDTRPTRKTHHFAIIRAASMGVSHVL